GCCNGVEITSVVVLRVSRPTCPPTRHFSPARHSSPAETKHPLSPCPSEHSERTCPHTLTAIQRRIPPWGRGVAKSPQCVIPRQILGGGRTRRDGICIPSRLC